VTGNLKPYSEYKDSGVPWIGSIPTHWDIRRMKLLLREVDLRSATGNEQLLRVLQYTGVTQRRSSNGSEEPDTRAASLIGYKRVAADDLIINIMLAWNGSMGVSRYDGIASPAYWVYRFKDGAQPWYFHELLRLPMYKGRIKAASTGVVGSRLRLYSDDLGRIESIVPPPSEQGAIVRFIDHTNRKIERFIRTKKKLIALLNEQKQAIIHRAVTRGLDPDVRLKPSGVPWLGDIPEHWELRRAKQVCSAIVDCKNRTPDMVPDGKYVVVRTTNVRHGHFRLDGSYPTDRRNYEIWTQRGAPRQEDVFFTREAPAGEACLVPNLQNLCMGQRMMYFRPNPEVVESKFLLHSIYGPVVRTYIEHACNGSTVGHLRLGQVSALPLLWCPLDEQMAIVAHIERESSPLDDVIARAKREIALLGEYRTRLIADVVTGKVDVREVAMNLPEETDEPEQFDDTAALADDEDMTDAAEEAEV